MSGIVRVGGQLMLTATFLYGTIWLIDKTMERLQPVLAPKTDQNAADEEQPYECKYMEEYLNLKNDPSGPSETESPTKIHESTPSGDVIMFYDDDLESFVYYCDNKGIPYKYLETVARKYTIHNRCLSKFVDTAEEIKTAVEKTQQTLTSEQPITASQNTIFANLKKGNANKSKNKKQSILMDKANRYSWRGCLAEGRELFVNTSASPGSNAESPPQAPKQRKFKMTFAQFKKEAEQKTTEVLCPTRNSPIVPDNSPVLEPSRLSNESGSEEDPEDNGPTFVKPKAKESEIYATEEELAGL